MFQDRFGRPDTIARLLPWADELTIPADANIVVNAPRSIGLYPDVAGGLPLREETLRPPMLVANVVPDPPRTALVRLAVARGCPTLDCLGMIAL